MPSPAGLSLVALALLLAPPVVASKSTSEVGTVCTLTLNSTDEKEAFRRHLPEPGYGFVELVDPGRADWLAASCRLPIACNVLVVSGHFDGSIAFYSEREDPGAYLPVAELERLSCSASCPALFSQLNEVYLFGCNTLSPRPRGSAMAEVEQSLLRNGRSAQQARRQLQSLNAVHGESSLDRMRAIFKGVPEIYGFTSKAPIGPVAGASLNDYFTSRGTAEVTTGRRNRHLLEQFARFGMQMASGVRKDEPQARAREDLCQFADDRLSTASRLVFLHGLLQRHVGEPRLHLDRILRLLKALDEPGQRSPAVTRLLEGIARDTVARQRFLDYAREPKEPAARVRMLEAAHLLGWLSAAERHQELALMLGELLARPRPGVAEVELACRLNEGRGLEGAFAWAALPGTATESMAQAAFRACLGSAEARELVMRGLPYSDERDAQIAKAYLRHRPVTDDVELRRLAEGVTRMAAGSAQVRALEALAWQPLSDPDVLARFTDLLARTPSSEVQEAIAAILLRADRRAIDTVRLLSLLRERRLRRGMNARPDDLLEALSQSLEQR